MELLKSQCDPVDLSICSLRQQLRLLVFLATVAAIRVVIHHCTRHRPFLTTDRPVTPRGLLRSASESERGEGGEMECLSAHIHMHTRACTSWLTHTHVPSSVFCYPAILPLTSTIECFLFFSFLFLLNTYLRVLTVCYLGGLPLSFRESLVVLTFSRSPLLRAASFGSITNASREGILEKGFPLNIRYRIPGATCRCKSGLRGATCRRATAR